MKDGGPKSTVTGYWLIEWKSLFSIAILKFEGKSREAFHTHAFNCVSIILKGDLTEHFICGNVRSLKKYVPFITKRTDFHKVNSDGTTFLLTFRGPWAKEWKEYIPDEDKYQTLKSGRQII
jgi:mevalonate pyrophosphate decarboxylase